MSNENNQVDELNQLGRSFLNSLARARLKSRERLQKNSRAEKVHVVGTGSIVTAAYEQLRNAAEYSEEHLLLQKAIKRFFRRLFLTGSDKLVFSSGDELVTELTFAGYVANDTVSEKVVTRVNKLAKIYYGAYLKIQASKKISSARAEVYVLDVLSVEVAELLKNNDFREVFAQFAFDYFIENIDKKAVVKLQKNDNFEVALYVAVHRALLKSDFSTIRAFLIRRFGQSPANFIEYCRLNKQISDLFESELVEKLYRLVDRQGAPLRIIGHLIDEAGGLEKALTKKTRFLSAFEGQIEEEYASINKKINRGIIKSVIFLVITKFLVGIAVEVPYDYMVHGQILWLPLIVNLFFPPVYMVLLRMTLILPSRANTVKLIRQAETMLYKTNSRHIGRKRSVGFSAIYNFVYGLLILAVFVGVSWVLISQLNFEIVHLVIFFIFLSGASFLGFRLSRMIRELESVDSQQNGITVLRDFLYMPFVIVGQWINEKYSKVNFVALALDMIIELPLKTVLRLIRQWGAFISSKKDQL